MLRPISKRLTGACLFAWLLCASWCHAEDVEAVNPAKPPVQTEVVMPVALEAVATLPRGASRNARVVLLIHLDDTGTVIDAKLANGEEPFASIAIEASQRFRFQPAQKNGVAVHCRFLFEVPWHIEREEENVSAVRVQRSIEANASARRPNVKPKIVAKELEVRVQGTRVPPGAQSLTANDARVIPGTFGDPLRAVETLPGITPVVSGLPYFYVRGAPPGNVGYLIDGVRVPLLWHALVGPSVVHPATLDKVTLYRGAYPAQYGRYAGAIVTADTVATLPQWRGEAGIRLIDTALMVNGPMGSARDGLPEATALVSGRYSYTGLALSLLSNKVDVGYWDYQALVTVPVSNQDNIAFLGLGAYDHLATTERTSSVQYHRADFRYDHRFKQQGGLRVAITVGRDDTGGNSGNVWDNLLGARLQLERRMSRRVVLHTGVDGGVDLYQLDLKGNVRYQTATTIEALLPTRKEAVMGAYVSIDYFPNPSIQVSPGVRVDYYVTEGLSRGAIDPRLSARFRLSRKVTTEHSVGIANQASVGVPGVPAAQVMSLKAGLQRSIQATSGITYQLDDKTSTSLVAFENIYWNLSDPLGTSHRLIFEADADTQRVNGAAYGLEVYLNRKLHDTIGGFLSYTLSRSTRSHNTVSTLSSVDRTHVINAALALDVGRRWRLGARGSFLSGLPIRQATNVGDLYHGDTRATPLFRLDLRVEKRWVLSERYWISGVIELMNATLSQELTERSCNPVRCTEKWIGPIVLPSVGVEAHF